MKYSVPQFIDVEDKIFGPLTFRQFAYLTGGGGLGFVAYKIIPSFWGILVAIPIVLFALALAFIKINEKPFINIVESVVTYAFNDKLYVWKLEKSEKPKPSQNINAETEHGAALPTISSSKLHDIAWGLDVLDK